MSQDLKVTILVVFVIVFSLGFALLVNPPALEDDHANVVSVDRRVGSKRVSDPKSTMDKYLGADYSVEIMRMDSDSSPVVSEPVEVQKPVIERPVVSDRISVSKEDRNTVSKSFDVVHDEAPVNLIQDQEVLSDLLEEDTTYTVKSGDTLAKISQLYYKDSKKYTLILEANQGVSATNLKIGMKLKIPKASQAVKSEVISEKPEKVSMNHVSQPVIYKVKAGDTISAIGRHFFGKRFSLEDFQKANPGKDLSKLKIGESIRIPPQR